MLSKILTFVFGFLKDSTGKPSWTYTIGVPAFSVITVKYAIAGTHVVVTVLGKPIDVEFGAMSGIDYATAAGCVLAYLTARAFTPGQAAQPPSQG
jgi:hypothetical protein